tara:strand:- start:259 stop:378 length:120 start_codon:yes stop_codon:yes gene_type:complete
MRKSRFTEGQIMGMIKEQEAGLPTPETSYGQLSDPLALD